MLHEFFKAHKQRRSNTIVETGASPSDGYPPVTDETGRKEKR